jgi:hypothetical protein
MAGVAVRAGCLKETLIEAGTEVRPLGPGTWLTTLLLHLGGQDHLMRKGLFVDCGRTNLKSRDAR